MIPDRAPEDIRSRLHSLDFQEGLGFSELNYGSIFVQVIPKMKLTDGPHLKGFTESNIYIYCLLEMPVWDTLLTFMLF